jgi:cellulose synthase/poly-beta-1,6-N-acetylglucosamine synthase-like glycosyltransferase
MSPLIPDIVEPWLNRLLSGAMTVVFVFAAVNYLSMFAWGYYSQLFLRSPRTSRRPLALQTVRNDIGLPGLTIIMPAYNEEVVIVDCVRSALALDYPDLRIMVVSDGSKDDTVGVLVDAFQMQSAGQPSDPASHGSLDSGFVSDASVHRSVAPRSIHHATVREVWHSRSDPRLTVIDKSPAGAKGDGANCGINFAVTPWVVVMDADELVNPDALVRAMTEIALTPNVVAAGVSLLPTNECNIVDSQIVEARVPKGLIPGFQLVEYLAAFFAARPGMAGANALHIVSGGFGIFRRESLIAVNGFAHPHLGEDMDLVIRLHRYYLERNLPYKILHVPEAIVWTEFPASAKVLKRQRIRWHRGLQTIIRDHRDIVFRRRYGPLGMLTFPLTMAFEWYAVYLEAAGWVIFALMLLTGVGSITSALLFMGFAFAIGVANSMLAIETGCRTVGVYQRPLDRLRLSGFVVLSQFGYRQLTLWWRVRSLWGTNQAWGAQQRIKLSTTSTPPQPTASPTLAVNPDQSAVARPSVSESNPTRIAS